MKGNMSMVVECEDCKKKFLVDREHMAFKKEVIINGQSIFLSYYDCSSCGRRHYVQIDDEVSLKMLEEVKGQFVKLSIAKRKGKEISQKQLVKFKNKRKQLVEHRRKLMEEYTGKSFTDEADKDVELRFSV